MRPRSLVLAFCLGLLAVAGSHGTPAAGGPYAVGTLAESVDLSAVPDAYPYKRNKWAVPIAAAKPDWLTPDVEQAVRSAAGLPVAAPPDAPFPSVVGIRPGAWMISPAGCTMNFVFTKGGAYAIGTAGHCVSSTGESVILLTLAPGGSNPVLVDIGTVLVKHDNGIGDDFALVSIRPVLNSWVSPTTAVIGGPCGTYGGSGPEILLHYGHGLAIGTGGTPRAGLSLTWRAASYGWDGAAIFGDSGSPVRLADLRAAGNLTHLVVDTNWLPSFIAGTRIGKMLNIAGGWSLADSSICLL